MSKSGTKAKSVMEILLVGLLLLICSSCTIRTKTVFIPPKTPVILMQNVENIKLAKLDEKTRELIEFKGNIYKGQHVISFDLSDLGIEVEK